MKVLHVINSLAAGGAERLLADLAPRLAARGVTCVVLCLDVRRDAFSAGLEAAGVRVRGARAGGANPYAPARLLDVLAAIREEKPDIVHAHLAPSFHWCAAASLAARGPAFLATEHAVANRRMALAFARPIERWCHGRYARIACVSAEAAASLRSWLGIEAERLAVIPNGVDYQRCSAATLPAADLAAWASGRRLIIMTARLVPAKDHRTALKILSLLPEDYAMAFVGDGPLRDELAAAAAELGLSERCRFLGSRGDVLALLACGQAYLQSSREEGFGIACLEAMAAGLPVAASAAGGLKPLVEGAGLLFPVGDAAGGAAALRRLCEEPAARSATVAAGRQRAEAHSMDRVADAYAELYAATRGAS